jgi:XTP/dITP diphosphohydrolase
MQRINVDSSDIVAIGYDPKQRLLEVEFNEGRTYEYQDVAPEVYKHFMQADSFGLYFNTHINNRYRYKKLTHAGQKDKTPPLAFVTGNDRKFRDLVLACAPYGIEIEQLDLPIDEIQSHDAIDIAVKKAKHAYELAQRPVVVMDAFWNILALRGFPGAFMAYAAKWLTDEDFLRLMQGKTDRTIVGTDTLVYYDGQRHKVFSRTIPGKLTEESRGKGAVQIDRILLIDGQVKTVAEIEDEESRSSIDPTSDQLYAPFVKWLHMQHRLGKV